MEGRAIPFWEDLKALALAAHRHFDDRIVIGWDIAVLGDGPIIIEGNSSPCMDIMQRFMRDGLRQHRFGELLAYHISRALAPPTLVVDHPILAFQDCSSELRP